VTAPYLDVNGFKLRTSMPPDDVDALEAKAQGFLLSRLVVGTSKINARLAKRYATPFTVPVPEIVLGWLTNIVTVEAYRKRGINPSDEQNEQIETDRLEALAELKEAADSENGLFDLPLREDLTASGISRGGPLVYSESSPYTWTREQARTGREEDSNGR